MQTNHPIVMYDGFCKLCIGSVKFIIKRDRKRRFRFEPFYGKWAEQILAQEVMGRTPSESLILFDEGKIWSSSDAALRIARQLDGAWPLLYVFILLPRIIRDRAYRIIASNRHRWFGSTETCWIPGDDREMRSEERSQAVTDKV